MRPYRSFNLRVAIASAAVVAILALVVGHSDGRPFASRDAGWYVRTTGVFIAITIALPLLARRVAPHPPSPDERATAAARHWHALRGRVAKILLRDWDPIGIQEVGPADEYDDYVAGILGLLTEGASERRLVDHLAHLQIDDIGMSYVDRAHLHAVARTLRDVDLGDLDPEVESDLRDAAPCPTPPQA